MSSPQGDGVSLREHLKIEEKASGITPAELVGPPLPFGAEFIWEVFQDLDASRGSNGMGPSRITEQDIFYWCANRRRRLPVWVIGVIRRLDTLWIKQYVATQKANAPPTKGGQS